MSDSMPEAVPETTPRTAPEAVSATKPDRLPSRQDLVVPPRPSNLSAIIGVFLCAVAGFGLVWGLGIGRGPRASSDSPPDAPTMARANDSHESSRPPDDASAAARPQEPDMLPLVDETAPAQPTAREGRWNSRPAGHETPSNSAADERYGVRPTSLDMPDAVLPASVDAATPQPLPRFGAADLEPVPDTVMTVAADLPADPQPASHPADLEPPMESQSTDLPPALVPATRANPEVSPSGQNSPPPERSALGGSRTASLGWQPDHGREPDQQHAR